ncbi:MAG: FAD-dependent oxidoreductase [Hahellaceae bacterium]|nr:FAD-dependent oxidoreductase [Hahellaceae bacterium]MCP5170522.1 FAD-dependent oxidoreductase [Hahellaceae bacterium]
MNTTQRDPIVIVGTGLAGYTLAREIRKLDKNTPIVMVTADDGYSYSKPMLSTGFSKQKTADELAMAEPGKMAEQLSLIVRTFTVVTGIKPQQHLLEINGESLRYSKLVLAWGADVIRIDIPGGANERIFSINDLMDYRRFRDVLEGKKRVLLMGAGLIGCEFANDLIAGGFEVDVVAPSDTALPGLVPKVIGDAVVTGLTQAGARFHLGRTVQEAAIQEGHVQVQLSDGEKLSTDLVVSAIGLRPRVKLADDAGLTINKGVVVNRALETSEADIYALGDCAEVDGHVMLYVMPLMACARTLAQTLTGSQSEVKYGVMPVVVKTPACPVAVAPPIGEGEWKIEQNGIDVKAECYDANGALIGFALSGQFVDARQQLARQVPSVHD